MPIHLRAPQYRPGGPDGRGWNRLSLNAHIGTPADQCALQPRDYPTLYESRTGRARWGGFGPCTSGGACATCPIYAAPPATLHAFTDRVLVRLRKRPAPDGLVVQAPPDEPHIMNRPEDGWGSRSNVWTWDALARLAGWQIGRRHRDEHSDGFWLVAETEPRHGVYGHPATKEAPDAQS